MYLYEILPVATCYKHTDHLHFYSWQLNTTSKWMLLSFVIAVKGVHARVPLSTVQ